MRVKDAMIAVDALLLYWHHTDPPVLFDVIYGARPTDDYVREKLKHFRYDGLIGTWNTLDFEHKRRLIKKALEAYGSVADRRIRFDMSKMMEDAGEVAIPHTDSPFVVQA